jgi:CubicO group peptidase (beta-lactamase class C family)
MNMCHNTAVFRYTVLLVGAFSALLLLSGCQSMPLSSRILYPPDESIERLAGGGSVADEVARLAAPLVESGEATGVAVGVLLPSGKTECYGFGRTGLPGARSLPAEDTIFEVGSLSKLAVLAVYCSLEQEGILQGSETLRDILPADYALSADAASLTLYELATHTGGFPRELRTLTQCGHFIKYLLTGRNLYSYMDRTWLKDYLAECALTPRAEREYVYSNLGMAILAYMMELKSGKPYPVLADEYVFRPLGMRDSFYSVPAEKRERLARGHVGDQPYFIRRHTELDDWDMGDLMTPTGALFSTLRDMLIFARANMGHAPPKLQRVFARMQEVQVTSSIENCGFGWMVAYCDWQNIRVLSKHGMVNGYSAYIGISPDTRAAVVALVNNFNWNEKVGHSLLLRIAGWEYSRMHQRTRPVAEGLRKSADDIYGSN